jgi:seryl-tRNA synthetase
MEDKMTAVIEKKENIKKLLLELIKSIENHIELQDEFSQVLGKSIKTQEEFFKTVKEQEERLDKFDSKIEHIDKEQRDIQIRLGVIEKTMVTKDELTSGLSNLKIDLIKWMIGLTLGNTALILTILKTFSKF